MTTIDGENVNKEWVVEQLSEDIFFTMLLKNPSMDSKVFCLLYVSGIVVTSEWHLYFLWQAHINTVLLFHGTLISFILIKNKASICFRCLLLLGLWLPLWKWRGLPPKIRPQTRPLKDETSELQWNVFVIGNWIIALYKGHLTFMRTPKRTSS